MVIAQTSTHQYPTTHVIYNPYTRPHLNGGKDLLVTCGRRHIRFWTLQGLHGAASLRCPKEPCINHKRALYQP
jgi:hypothetical protein